MKITLMDHVVTYFAEQGPDAEMQINIFLDEYVTRKRERQAEEMRFRKQCIEAQARAKSMRDRGINDAEAVGPAIMVPRHEMEIGQYIWSPREEFHDGHF